MVGEQACSIEMLLVHPYSCTVPSGGLKSTNKFSHNTLSEYAKVAAFTLSQKSVSACRQVQNQSESRSLSMVPVFPPRMSQEKR